MLCVLQGFTGAFIVTGPDNRPSGQGYVTFDSQAAQLDALKVRRGYCTAVCCLQRRKGLRTCLICWRCLGQDRRLLFSWDLKACSVKSCPFWQEGGSQGDIMQFCRARIARPPGECAKSCLYVPNIHTCLCHCCICAACDVLLHALHSAAADDAKPAMRHHMLRKYSSGKGMQRCSNYVTAVRFRASHMC